MGDFKRKIMFKSRFYGSYAMETNGKQQVGYGPNKFTKWPIIIKKSLTFQYFSFMLIVNAYLDSKILVEIGLDDVRQAYIVS